MTSLVIIKSNDTQGINFTFVIQAAIGWMQLGIWLTPLGDCGEEHYVEQGDGGGENFLFKHCLIVPKTTNFSGRGWPTSWSLHWLSRRWSRRRREGRWREKKRKRLCGGAQGGKGAYFPNPFHFHIYLKTSDLYAIREGYRKNKGKVLLFYLGGGGGVAEGNKNHNALSEKFFLVSL